MNQPERVAPDLSLAMRSAYAGTLRHASQLVAIWRSNLTSERARELRDFEDKGLRLGILIVAPQTGLVVQVLLTDTAGGITPLDTIELAGS